MGRPLAVAALLACLGASAQAAELAPSARQEIDHLLDHLGRSRCEFYRNGTWHGAAEARSHLETKLGYLVKKGMVSTADEFIDLAATRSSVSGEPYQVRCAPAAAVPSRDWFRAELARYRAAPKSD